MYLEIDCYIDAASRRRSIPGGGRDGLEGHDCSLFIANWCVALGCPDPAGKVRGRYRTIEEAEDLIRRAGGMMAFAASMLEPIGWRRVAYPRNLTTGDVGLLLPPRDGRLVSLGGLIPAIRRADAWISADPVGLAASMLSDRAVWRRPA